MFLSLLTVHVPYICYGVRAGCRMKQQRAELPKSPPFSKKTTELLAGIGIAEDTD